ncbi:MAG: nucleotidyltransferase domain-containing protein [Candidatus Omnitrophota bacterium]
MECLKLDMVRDDLRKTIEPYLLKLLEIHHNNIISMILYGSATGGDFSPKTSDINLLIVFHTLEFDQLKRSLKLISSGINKKIAAPLFLSRRHIDTSQDVFPIEFLEIKENHITIFGEDLFKDMQIEQKHIRVFCEQQIKGKLIRLRQAYLEIGLKHKGVEALMKESLYGLMPIFRALIRISGITPMVEKEKILNQLAKNYSLDEEVFIAILKDKKDDEKIAGCDIQVFFEKYICEIKKLAIAVDKL